MSVSNGTKTEDITELLNAVHIIRGASFNMRVDTSNFTVSIISALTEFSTLSSVVDSLTLAVIVTSLFFSGMTGYLSSKKNRLDAKQIALITQ